MKHIIIMLSLASCASFHSRGLTVYDKTNYRVSQEVFENTLNKASSLLGNRAYGYDVYLYSKLIHIPGPNNTMIVADGFTDIPNKVIIISTFTECLPASALIHELAHTIYGDQGHEDEELWENVAQLEAKLKNEICTPDQIMAEQEKENTTQMKALDKYFELQKEIFDYFGYREDWKVIPIDDRREMYWQLLEEGDSNYSRGSVIFHTKPLTNNSVEAGEIYEDEIYTQRFLPKWVYRGAKYTMICVNPRTDGNHFLAIFDNAREQKDITARFDVYGGI